MKSRRCFMMAAGESQGSQNNSQQEVSDVPSELRTLNGRRAQENWKKGQGKEENARLRQPFLRFLPISIKKF
ncbi:unnamed protein product [Nippostrongylus brasiliensis]|uniref:Uncharacterized protein n=1 Tax=Nippostrongylus brasiliensis TaxID=27835 RepID=A0A0N4Y2A8_NIPBR|nr:unnamed protein product [Nippostrongylus brasiliensis]